MIDPYDTTAVMAVWQRVRRASAPKQSLCELCSLELERSRRCHLLARRFSGLRPVAAQMEADCRSFLQLCRRLEAGPILPAVAREGHAPTLQEFRQEAAVSAERLRRAAEAHPQAAKLLTRLARKAQQQSQMRLGRP